MTSDLDPTPDAQVARGRIIVVASPKGGVGKSTVATNLAILLARQDPLRTVLVDLDMQFGDVASQLDLKPDHTISDAVSVGLSDTMLFKTFLAPHPSGLLVLAGVDSPVAGGRISDEQAADVLKLLASEFPVVIVDTGSGLVDHTLAALELATDVVLVTNMGVSSIKSVRRELDLLAALELTFTRHVVLNFCDRISGLTVEVAQGVVGCPIDVVLPRVEDGPLAANIGIPIVLRKKPGVMGKGLSDLASRLGLETPVEEDAGRWGSKRWKRQRELLPAQQTSEPEQTPEQEQEPEQEPRANHMSWDEWKSKRQTGEEGPAQEERTEQELAPYGLAEDGTGQVARAKGEMAEGELAEEETGKGESAEEESAEEESAEEESAEEDQAEHEPTEDEQDEEEQDEEEQDEEDRAEEEQSGRRKRWERKGWRLTGEEEQVQGEASQNEPGERRKRRDRKRRRVMEQNEQAERDPSQKVQVQGEQEETSPEKRA